MPAKSVVARRLMLCIVALSLPQAWPLQDGGIGILYIGCIARSPPFNYMASDPLFSVNFVIATLRDWAGMEEKEVHRRVRLYMPRSYDQLTTNFDLIAIANPTASPWTAI